MSKTYVSVIVVVAVAGVLFWLAGIPYSCSMRNRAVCEFFAAHGSRAALMWAAQRDYEDFGRTGDKEFLYRYYQWLIVGADSGDASMRSQLDGILNSRNELSGSNYQYLTLQAAAAHGDSQAVDALKRAAADIAPTKHGRVR